MAHTTTLATLDSTTRTLATTPAQTRLAALRRRLDLGDAGMATAEYAVGTVAACGFGGLLWKMLTSDSMRELILSLFTEALKPFLG